MRTQQRQDSSLQDLATPSRADIIAEAQRSFAEALPRIEGLAGAYLRMPRSERKDEAVAEVVALSWKGYLDLSLRGENVEKLLGKIVWFAAQGVRSGRGLVGQPSINDVMSPRARFHHGLHSVGEPRDHERTDNTSPVEQAATNVDFGEWLNTLPAKRREIALALTSGLNSTDVGKLRGVTRAAIYLDRLGLKDSWDEFHGGG